MKKILTITALTVGFVASSLAQGFFNFDNTAAYTGSANNPNYAYIGANGAVGEGAIGATIGSDATFATPNYDISFLWFANNSLVGSSDTPAQFITAGANTSSLVGTFSAITGDDTDGAGLVGAGTVTLSSPATVDGQNISVQLIAWYDPTGTTTYAQALSDGYNTGYSAITQIRLAAGQDQNIADISGFTKFALGTAVPEPTTIALASLGGISLLALRRRKTV